MSCPRDAIGNAISKCPFLHQVSARQGEDYARQIATRPSVPATKAGFGPIFEEKACDFEATLRLFHGPTGVVPLKKVAASSASSEQAAPQAEQSSHAAKHGHDRPVARRSPVSAAPFASINMAAAFSFLPSPSNVADSLFGKKGSSGRKPQSGRGHGSSSSSQRGSGSSRTGPNSSRTGTTSSRTGSKGRVAGQAAGAKSSGGQCPLRKVPGAAILGGLIPLSAKGELQCPRFIVAGRAAVARLQPVRDLRPQALPVKLATLGTGTALLNIPFGMWREHTRKFSPEWFVAVHATIPFVAMTRQGIGMPKTVIFLTIGSAILGQAFGARLEQQRLLLLRQHQEKHEAEQREKQLREDRQAAAARRQQTPFPCAVLQAAQERVVSMPRLQNHILSLAHDFGHNVATVGA